MNSNTAFLTVAEHWPRLEPAMDPMGARTKHVQLVVSKSFVKGQVVMPVLASPGVYDAPNAGSGAIAAPTAAPTFGTPGAGTVPAGDYIVGYTYTGASGETVLSTTATHTVGSSENLPIAAIAALPTGVVAVKWYMSDGPGSHNLKFIASRSTNAAFNITALPAVTAVGPPATSNALATASTTGTRGGLILEYPCTTNAAGEISLGATSFDNDTKFESISAYYTGKFKVSDLTGINSDADLALVSGHLVQGTTYSDSNAIVSF
jgi:hypothetical protein